jgi:galactose mutarotase-like enzyme
MEKSLETSLKKQVEESWAKSERLGSRVTIKSGEFDSISATIRSEGGYLESFKVAGIEFLYSDPKNPDRVKKDASHPMSPVGPGDPQHGIERWLKHQITKSIQGEVELKAEDPHQGITMKRKIEIVNNILEITSSITNNTNEIKNTSLGEHLYFFVDEEKISDILVSGDLLSVITPEGEKLQSIFSDLADKILTGASLYVENANLGIERSLKFPDGKLIKIKSRIGKGIHSPINMLIWHRKGTNSICFEPIIGAMRDSTSFKNTEYSLGPGESLEMITQIVCSLE